MSEKKENIIMFPFMAQGHIIPFLALALQLEQQGRHVITFVTTPLNILNLRPRIPPSSSIILHEIPFDSAAHGLPPGIENTDALPYHHVITLLSASSVALRPAFRSLLAGLVRGGTPPLCVISDIFFGWAGEVAHKLDLFHVVFSGAGGYGLACYYSTWMNLPHLKSNSHEFTLPDFPESGKFHVTQLATSYLKADGKDKWSIFQHKNLPAWAHSDGIMFNTIEEIEKTGLNFFRQKLGLPVWAVGPVAGQPGRKNGVELEKCIEWLDTKMENSVLYISFGSMNTISALQMMELGKALDEAKNVNFVWVVRPPLGFDITAEFRAEEWLPEGFVRRVVEEQRRGLVVHQWAPQVEILSHRSVGAFLSHCGWNSVLESLSHGVPLMGWPMAAEQFFNAKFLVEEVGVCVEVARGTNLEVTQKGIVEKMNLVFGKCGNGEEMRRKARELKLIIKDAVRNEDGFMGSSVKAMDEFLEAAKSMKKTKENENTKIKMGC